MTIAALILIPAAAWLAVLCGLGRRCFWHAEQVHVRMWWEDR